MLNTLTINNIVIIDKANIEFGLGLCVLSGETGSGKSILLDALGLAIGFRSNARLIGSDSEKSQVTAEFDISNNNKCQKILEENDLIDDENPNLVRIRRSITLNNQKNVISKNKINDIAIGTNLLSEIGQSLIEIHGQHDQGSLLNAKSHGQILDEFAQNHDLLQKLGQNYHKLKQIETKINDLKAKAQENEREKDYLQHIIAELEDANIQNNEEDQLINQKNQLSSKEKMLNFISQVNTNLVEANSQLIMGQKAIIRSNNIIDNFDQNLSDKFSQISDIIDKQNEEIDKITSDFDDLASDINQSDNNLEEIEERLFLIRNLSRKHNVSANDLANLIEESQIKLQSISDEEILTKDLEQELTKLTTIYHDLATKLDKKRRQAAKILAKKVEEELKFLKMAEVNFIIDIQNLDNSQPNSPNGYNKIRFLAAINQDKAPEKAGDISKIASGGELSRFMLALKVSLMHINSSPTVIFDEIDSGIGGKTANAVGERLKNLAQNLQILVVTHQPQIAAKANNHFKISKTKDNSKIKTLIKKLDKNQSQEEIARMLSGENITKEALAAAKKLID